MSQGDRTQGNTDANYRNLKLVDEAFREVLVPGLTPFIKRRMKAKYRPNWLQHREVTTRSYHIVDGDLNWGDPQLIIDLLLNHWKEAFFIKDKLERSELNLVYELKEVRNAVKHEKAGMFTDDYTWRSLDSIARLLTAIPDDKAAREKAQEAERRKEEFRSRSQGDNQVEEKPEQVVNNQPAVVESSKVNHQFQALIDEKTEGFVGREFVFKAIENFLASQPNGYFIVEADPGMGKTAILAEYVRRTGCIVHFNIRSQAINRTDQFLESVCSQIILRYNLGYPSLTPEMTRDGKFFAKLLEEISAKLKTGERLVIAIDALDEVNQTDYSGGNILYLPVTLPKGVYFVLTQRAIALPLTVNTPPHRFTLMQYQAESLQDIQTYIRREIEKSPQLKVWIDGQKLAGEDFVTLLAEKSENNFMYLKYVLEEIERGFYRDLSIDNLPQGLQAYYEDHWRRMGMIAKPLPRHKIKIVYVLAEARKPVSRQLICDFTGEDALTVQDVLYSARSKTVLS
ncbi:MAG: Swt1 family HEPN domain-containing protein [Phormidium sp.]